MARLRYNGLTATLGAALTSSATSVTFGAALTHAAGSVPTIASPDYLSLTILDTSGNVSEIVSLTAYTSGATTGTISRAQEGTTGVAHSSGDKVVHGATVLDIPDMGEVLRLTQRTTGQSIAATTVTDITWDTRVTDPYGMFSSGTTVTVPAGFPEMTVALQAQPLFAAAPAAASCQLYVNGTKVADTSNSAVYLTRIRAGDIIKASVYQTSSTRPLSTSAPYTWLSIFKLIN